MAKLGEWQSIETAPKDGTHILVCLDRFRDVVWWVIDGWTDGEYEWSPNYFTHWMPLPAPPARSQEQP